jgi:hypothetical protein
MTEPNPYQAPESRPESVTAGRFRWRALLGPLKTLVRASVGLWGLFILAGPARVAPGPGYQGGPVLAKAFGALLFLVAIFPFGRPRGTRSEKEAMEEL